MAMSFLPCVTDSRPSGEGRLSTAFRIVHNGTARLSPARAGVSQRPLVSSHSSSAGPAQQRRQGAHGAEPVPVGHAGPRVDRVAEPVPSMFCALALGEAQLITTERLLMVTTGRQHDGS